MHNSSDRPAGKGKSGRRITECRSTAAAAPTTIGTTVSVPRPRFQCSGGYPAPLCGLHHSMKVVLAPALPQLVEQFIERGRIDGNPLRPDRIVTVRVAQQIVER